MFTAALFTKARTGKQAIFPSTVETNKEDVVHTDNGILLGHKKELNWVTWRDMDIPRDCHTN